MMLFDATTRSALDIPPFYFAFACLSVLMLHFFFPIVDLIDPPLSRFGWVLIAAGFGLAIWAERLFTRAGTGVRPFTTSTALVAAGPYRFTRNPMYLGMMLALLGCCVFTGSLSSFLVVPVCFWLIRTRFVLREEEHMEAAFGDDYLAYKQRVRRWL